MGVTRAKAVKRHKKKELTKALKWVVGPPVIAGALLFGTCKKKRRRKKKIF